MTETTEQDPRAKAIGAFYTALRDRDHDKLRELGSAQPELLKAIDPAHCCGGTVMNVAVGFGDTDLLETLLGLGADPNQPSDWPPGPFRALNSIPDQYHDSLGPWLIERGAEPDAHAAAKLGMKDRVEQLLELDPEALHRPGPDGQRPLHVARTPEIARSLLDAGADIEAKCIDHGSTPAEYAATDRVDVCRALLDRGARGDEFMYALIGDLERLQTMLAEDPEVLHARSTPERFTSTEDEAAHIYMYSIGSNATLMHAAVAGAQPDVVGFLAERGLDGSLRGGYDDGTPAHGAAWNDEAVMIRTLVANGANVDLPSGEIHNNPPIGWAIVNGSANAVDALLEAGVEIRDYYEKDAKAGKDGAFREWSASGPERFEHILASFEAERVRRETTQ